jgi:hypothetical protein
MTWIVVTISIHRPIGVVFAYMTTPDQGAHEFAKLE